LIDKPRGLSATSINVTGTIAGYGAEQGFVVEPGGKVTLFGFPIEATSVSGINASGWIAGTYYDDFLSGNANDYHPYVRDPSGNLTPFLTARSCAASGINEPGEITGGCKAGDAFVRTPWGAIELFVAPPDSDCQSISGTAINRSGVVTGTCKTASGAIHGFVRIP
jgi:hypothetical protein